MLYCKAAKDSVIMTKDSLDGEKDLRKSILSGPGTIADGINAAWKFRLHCREWWCSVYCRYNIGVASSCFLSISKGQTLLQMWFLFHKKTRICIITYHCNLQLSIISTHPSNICNESETYFHVVLPNFTIFHLIKLYSHACFYRNIQRDCQFPRKTVCSISWRSYFRYFNWFLDFKVGLIEAWLRSINRFKHILFILLSFLDFLIS